MFSELVCLSVRLMAFYGGHAELRGRVLRRVPVGSDSN